jgi:hypothetical protein
MLNDLRGPHAKAVAVRGRQRHVFPAGGFGDRHPLAGVEIRRVELPAKVVVNRDGDFAWVRAVRVGVRARPANLRPLQGNGAPVKEQAKARRRESQCGEECHE